VKLVLSTLDRIAKVTLFSLWFRFSHLSQIIPTSRNAFDRAAPGFAYDGGSLATPCTCADKGTGCAQGTPATMVSACCEFWNARASN
jgi:hypothetical protein